jgi:hypothetical protein
METQTQNQKPFGSEETSGATELNDFTIRTMQDDLLNFNKNFSTHSTENISSKGPTPQTGMPSTKNTQPTTTTAAVSSSPFSNIEKDSLVKPTQNTVSPSHSQQAIERSAAVMPIRPAAASPLPPPASSNKNIPNSPTGSLAQKKKSSLISILVSLVILVVILGIGGGIYYFLMTRTTTTTTQPPQKTPAQDNTAPTQPAVTINPPTEKYSSDKPNYLPIDFTNSSSSDIAKALNDVVPDLGASAASTPTEFIVVDTNNNPAVFHIFASAIKLNLSQGVLNSLGDNFSIYYFKDGVSTRLGIAIDIKDMAVLKAALLKEESILPTELLPLFLSTTPEIKSGVFKDNSYQGDPIRYLNLDSQDNMSIDYTITAKQFIIGTSKNTLRAIIDKQSSAATQDASTDKTPINNSPTTTDNSAQALPATTGNTASSN